MSAIFEGYEKEFLEYTSGISRKTALIPTLQREDKKVKVSEAENDLAEAEALIRRMDLEARSLPAGIKTPLLNKLRDYKASLQKLKTELKKASTSLVDTGAARDELLSRAELGDTVGGAATSAGQRDRLMGAIDRAKTTSDRIQQGKKTIAETEDLGVSILQDLHRQRETIMSARDTLHGADENIGKARRVLSEMSKRATQNKVVLGGIILLLLGGIILIIYVQVKK